MISLQPHGTLEAGLLAAQDPSAGTPEELPEVPGETTIFNFQTKRQLARCFGSSLS